MFRKSYKAFSAALTILQNQPKFPLSAVIPPFVGIRKLGTFSHQSKEVESNQNVSLISRIRRKICKPLNFFARMTLLNRYICAKYNAVGKLDSQMKKMLRAAAAQLCYDCSNRYPYKELCQEFGLEDYFSTWFKLTLLHIWMILVRLQQSLDADAIFKIREEILSLFWEDTDKRLKIFGEEIGINLKNRNDLLKMHGLYIQTLVEYDEGFLSSDHVLAGAIWRCLYVQKDFDPVRIRTAIYYIRGTMAYLNSLDIEDILVNGIKQWRIANPSEDIVDNATAEL